MDIYVQSEIGECGNFTFKGKKEKSSIIISPLRIEGPELRLKIASGCNLFVDCEYRSCLFSAAGRSRERLVVKKRED